MATSRVPETAVGVRSRSVASLLLGMTRTHSLVSARICSISGRGTSRFILITNPWLWQRIVPTRTQIPSTTTGGLRPRILLDSAMPFHSSRVWPPDTSLSIQARRLPASGAPNSSLGRDHHAIDFHRVLRRRFADRFDQAAQLLD